MGNTRGAVTFLFETVLDCLERLTGFLSVLWMGGICELSDEFPGVLEELELVGMGPGRGTVKGSFCVDELEEDDDFVDEERPELCD